MKLIKYSKDKKKLSGVISSDDNFKRVDRKAVRVINAVTNSDLKYEESEETIDMCKAIEDISRIIAMHATGKV